MSSGKKPILVKAIERSRDDAKEQETKRRVAAATRQSKARKRAQANYEIDVEIIDAVNLLALNTKRKRYEVVEELLREGLESRGLIKSRNLGT